MFTYNSALLYAVEIQNDVTDDKNSTTLARAK